MMIVLLTNYGLFLHISLSNAPPMYFGMESLCMGETMTTPNALDRFAPNLYAVNGMMSVIHRIETKDTGNPLVRAYNKIKERTAVLKSQGSSVGHHANMAGVELGTWRRTRRYSSCPDLHLAAAGNRAFIRSNVKRLEIVRWKQLNLRSKAHSGDAACVETASCRRRPSSARWNVQKDCAMAHAAAQRLNIAT
jgi:hypothetical protein